MLRVSEIYTTVQGEGPNVGRPTTFVRFAGCNMRCPGWPCDTQYAIQPELIKDNHTLLEAEDVFDIVAEQYPNHVCITGGEPLLQPEQDLVELLGYLNQYGYTVDVFTNGSISYDKVILHLQPHVTIVQDWKLRGSGESMSFRDVRYTNARLLRRTDAIKFVAKDRPDLHEMKSLLDAWKFLDWPHHPRPYVGIAWGELEEREAVEFLETYKLRGVYFNTQVHKYIFDPKERAI